MGVMTLKKPIQTSKTMTTRIVSSSTWRSNVPNLDYELDDFLAQVVAEHDSALAEIAWRDMLRLYPTPGDFLAAHERSDLRYFWRNL